MDLILIVFQRFNEGNVKKHGFSHFHALGQFGVLKKAFLKSPTIGFFVEKVGWKLF